MPYLKKPKRDPPKRVTDSERKSIYASTRWKRLRQSKLLQQPLCELCLQEGIVTPAVDVHHIDSFTSYSGMERLYKAFDFGNLMSICKYHHGLIHNKQI